MSSKIDMKVVLLGKEYGGKTSLVERFIYGRFDANVPYQNTIGAAFGAKTLSVDGRSVTLGIWDTAGSERYEAMSKIYYRGAKAAVVCFDLTDATSWERAKFWIQEVNGHEENCKVYLCGTKRDLLSDHNRGTDPHDSVDYADSIGSRLFETSSKTGDGVEELFEAIVEDFVREPERIHYQPDQDKIVLGNEDNQKGQSCSGCSGLVNWK